MNTMMNIGAGKATLSLLRFFLLVGFVMGCRYDLVA